MGNVTTLQTVDSTIISFILLVFILFSSYNRTDRLFLSHKLFISLVLVNMFMLAVNYFSWAFNALPGDANIALNKAFNCLLYVSAPAAPILWLLYVDYQIKNDSNRLKKFIYPLLALFSVNAILSVISLFTGWYYFVDAYNVYSRGDLFLVHALLNYGTMAYTLIFVLINRRFVEKKYFYSLLLFFVPPLAGTTLQIIFYGLAYNWVGMALGALIVYFNIQNKGLNTDYLTGAYNRRLLDGYTKSKAKAEGNSFAAIMLDIDDFKQINDKYGHDVGDDALKDAVSIVRGCIRENDFIARSGGDEFIVILDMQDQKKLESAKDRIEQGVAEFNRNSSKPYRISFSYGYGVYDVKSGAELDGFFRRIDKLMYEDKNEKKARAEQG